MQGYWQRTAQYQKVIFKIFEAYNYKYVVEPREWPADLRWVIEAFLKEEKRWTQNDLANNGTTFAAYASPRFFVAVDRTLVAVAAGLAGWKAEIEPALIQLVGS